MGTQRLFLPAVVLLALAAAVRAEVPTLRIARVAEPPAIERYLDAKTEPPGTKIIGFVQREPADNAPVSQPTTAYLSYDEKQLYVAFVCRDDPAKVRAHLSKREAISGDEFVGIILDTYHDQRRAYLFIANPLGIQMDGVTTEGQSDDYSYDALWKSEGRLTADGYVVLMEIPFKSLRFSTAPHADLGRCRCAVDRQKQRDVVLALHHEKDRQLRPATGRARRSERNLARAQPAGDSVRDLCLRPVPR